MNQAVPGKWQLAWATGVWLAGAVALSASGALMTLPPVAVQGLLVILTAVLLTLLTLSPGVRRWVFNLDVRAILLLHLTRFVGIYFLMLNRRGELPTAFAVPSGWGDILVASLALILLTGPSSRNGSRWPLYLWNTLGLADILLVVANAARLNLTLPGSMWALTVLPLSLLPTFLVPLIIASHVALYVRLRQPQPVPRVQRAHA